MKLVTEILGGPQAETVKSAAARAGDGRDDAAVSAPEQGDSDVANAGGEKQVTTEGRRRFSATAEQRGVSRPSGLRPHCDPQGAYSEQPGKARLLSESEARAEANPPKAGSWAGAKNRR